MMLKLMMMMTRPASRASPPHTPIASPCNDLLMAMSNSPGESYITKDPYDDDDDDDGNEEGEEEDDDGDKVTLRPLKVPLW